MKKLLPLLCIAAFAASQYSYADSWKERREAKQAAKREAKEKERERSKEIAKKITEQRENYEGGIDKESAQELVQQAKLLTTKCNSVIKALTTIESLIDKSRNKKFNALKDHNISIVPVMKRPFSNMKDQLKWLLESVKLMSKGFVAIGKIKQENTTQEVDARGNISLGLCYFPALEFYLFDLEYTLVSLFEFIKTHGEKLRISDAAVIQKSVKKLETSMSLKEKKLFSKAQDTLANSIEQFKSACDALCDGKADSDNTLKELNAYKTYLDRLEKSVERFSSFLNAFETLLSNNASLDLRSLADECRGSLANKGRDKQGEEGPEEAEGYDESYLDAEEDDDAEQQSRPLRSARRTRISTPSRERTREARD